MESAPRQRALAFLEAHHVLTLATQGSEGPWAAAVFYASRGFTLYFLSASTTRHARNLAGAPRVAGTIQEDVSDWLAVRGIQLEGTARLLAGEEAEEARRIFGRRFPLVQSASPPPEIAEALSRIGWYELRPERLHLVDNAAGFGKREEIPLP